MRNSFSCGFLSFLCLAVSVCLQTGKFSHLIEQERVTEKGGRELPGIRNTMVRDLLQSNNRGRILGQNPDESLTSFPPCYSVTSTALPWDFFFFKLKQPLTVSRIQFCPNYVQELDLRTWTLYNASFQSEYVLYRHVHRGGKLGVGPDKRLVQLSWRNGSAVGHDLYCNGSLE